VGHNRELRISLYCYFNNNRIRESQAGLFNQIQIHHSNTELT
jgi:hypothetical protein